MGGIQQYTNKKKCSKKKNNIKECQLNNKRYDDFLDFVVFVLFISYFKISNLL